jgi:hypothetical protein
MSQVRDLQEAETGREQRGRVEQCPREAPVAAAGSGNG